jgi:hypothetical protein
MMVFEHALGYNHFSMPFLRRLFFLILLMGFWGTVSEAVGPMLKSEPVVPSEFAFIRSLDVDTFVERTNRDGLGAQSTRLRLRFIDPDENAFVGMVAGFHHFNQDLQLGDPAGPDTAGVMAEWGGVFGIVRGKHLWELDLQGASLSNRLGFAPAIVGEHHLSNSWIFYHRTEIDLFTGDAILDADQGFYWMWKPSLGLSFGYRWFTSLHMDRSGPHIGVRYFFQSPKIPFIFPSLG